MRRLVAWARAHRSAATTTVAAVVVSAVVVTTAVVSTGFEAQRVDLDDGTVWVAAGELAAVGRANTDVAELNSAVRTSGDDLRVRQSGQDVVVVDRGSATVSLVDTATAAVVDDVPLPPADPDVALAGDRAVVASGGTGGFWSVETDGLSGFVADSEPDLSLGADAVSAVAPSGRLVAWSADTDEVSVVGSLERFEVDETHRADLPDGAVAQVATVGDHWAVLDTASGTLVVDGARVDLGSRSTGGLALQQSSDEGDSLLVATGTGLLSVPFDGGGPTGLVADRDGLPARPVVVDGCRWAAWADGSAWSDCVEAGQGVLALDQVSPTAALVFDVNGRRTMLSDPTTGASWAVQRGGTLVDNWGDLLQDDEEQDETEENDADLPPELDPDQKPPVAVDDDLGARPGRATTLPVLLNDFDPNGDPIALDSTGDVDPAVGRADIVNEGQQVLLTLADDATGVVPVEYTISDGRGGTATAVATVTVRGADENGAPQQARTSTASVATSGRVETNVLGDWVDPDGDAVYLKSATGPGVTGKPSGEVVYQDDGSGRTEVDVPVVVSDGRADSSGVLRISVDGAAPLVAESFTVKAYAGRQTTVDPLEYVSGGSGRARLNSVPPVDGATVTPAYEKGTFRFASDEVRSHAVEYTVTDGDQSATGTVRVDVQSPPDAATPPVTVPKTVFVRTLSTETVDVTATDRDPAGNVLMVTGTSGTSAEQGVRVEALEQRWLRTTLTAPLETGTTSFTYTVTNGVASAEGVVTVVEIPPPSVVQPPVAVDDAATVRVGDVLDVDVLANDEQPDGDDVTLVPQLDEDVPEGGGLLFTAGDRLRYLAPETPGDYTAQYRITGADGQSASARVDIAVREADAATNSAPVPQTVTGRVVAGESLRLRVPLDGIDADGDTVQLIGVDTNPEKGAVTSVGRDYLEYEADAGQAGTDTFTYSVVDGLGARATGTVRIGISARADTSRAPVAVADTVRMRPGGSIAVRVLDNDSDPDGGTLTVTGVEAGDDDVRAEVLDGTTVSVTPPREEGEHGLVYTVENETGGASSSFVTVVVDRDAPLSVPLADDSVLDLRDVLDRDTVRVDVLRNVFFASGPVSELGLGLEPGYGSSARVTADRRIEVEVQATSQIVPFWVSHPDDDSLRAHAFVVVPGRDDALPQVDRTAPPITVVSEQSVDIDLERYVLASGGRTVRVTDASTVRATHADGEPLVVDPTTLRFTSADLYFGQASISFEVTDGTSADDPDGRRATLVLPIRVTPRENQPPALTGTALELEPGQSRSIDLTRLTTYPYPDDVGELRYAVDAASVPGFTWSIADQTLTVTADTGTPKGTVRALPVTVSDAVAQGRSGTVSLSVVASTRPLAQPAADRAVVPRGKTTTVDVLANDQATNPFPGEPLRVVAIRGLDGSSVPSGVRIVPSDDSRRLSVSVDGTAAPVDTNLQYQVEDVTGDPDRRVWGTVTVSVQDVPGTPNAPVRTGAFRGGQLTLSYQSPAANNSPIVGYRVTGTATGTGTPYARDCGVATICTLTDLDPAQTYTFSVVATNGVGDSVASALSAPYSADYVPAAPQNARLTPSTSEPGTLVASWDAVSVPRGSSVSSYVVDLAGAGQRREVGASGRPTANFEGLTPGQSYSVTVFAKNAAQVGSEADWARSSSPATVAVGAPTAAQALRADSDFLGRGVTVSWSPGGAQGGQPLTYTVRRTEGAAPTTCGAGGTTIGTPTTGTSAFDDQAADGTTYTYTVDASNGLFCTPTSTTVTSVKPPARARATFELVVDQATGAHRVVLRSASVPSLRQPDHFELLVDGATSGPPVSPGAVVPGLVAGTSYSLAVRACATSSSDYCGDASDTSDLRPVDTRGQVLACTVGDDLRWQAPDNTGSPTSSSVVEYSAAASGDSWRQRPPGDDAAAYTTDGAVPEDALRVRVKTTVDGKTDPGHATATCS